MNVFNQLEIEGEPLLESCDECNALIVNWETLTNSFLTFDNRVVCKKCFKESVDFPEEILQDIPTMIEEPELSMKLKTYNVVLRINTLEDENTEGDPIISEYLQSELEKKISEEHMFTDQKGGALFLISRNVENITMVRSISAFK